MLGKEYMDCNLNTITKKLNGFFFFMKEGGLMKFHNKQIEVIKSMKYDNPKIMICSGAKRS